MIRSFLVWICGLILLTGCATSEKAAKCTSSVGSGVCIRINCGADKSYKDKKGNVWAADNILTKKAKFGAMNGSTVLRDQQKVNGTDCPEIYLSECYGMTGYKIRVPNGKYTVRLHFAETFYDVVDVGGRVFDVMINDKIVLNKLDPYKEGKGLFMPVVKQFKGIKARNGEILVGFKENVQSPEINGIEVIAE